MASIFPTVAVPLRAAAAALSTVLLSGCSLFGIRAGYEQPPYEVIGHLGDAVEVRRYAARLAAETTVAAPDAEAGQDAAFRILAAYIFGANRTKTGISMTAPVAVEAPAERIAMTAPVQSAPAADGTYVMRFFLPASLTLATAPQPTDADVRLVEVPAETIAALRFTGSRGAAAVDAQRAALSRALQGSPWRPTGVPANYFYDPPWTIPFLRRNEVTVAVAPR